MNYGKAAAMKKVKSRKQAGPSKKSRQEIPEIDFANARISKNTYAARIAKEGITIRIALGCSRLTSRCQVSIPTEVRRRLGLEPGAVLEWSEEDGKIIVRRAIRYSSEDIHRVVFAQSAPTPRSDAALKTGISRRMKSRYTRR